MNTNEPFRQGGHPVAHPTSVQAPVDSFFRHHGPWAPGVRLFRKLRFGAKAGLISLAVTFPMGSVSELYGFGANETLLGELLSMHRERIVLTSKCGMQGVDGVRVIELSTDVAGAFTGRLLALYGADVVAVSVDSPFAQEAWAKANKITVTLCSDLNKEVTKAYGVLFPMLAGIGDTSARAAFVIGKDGVVTALFDNGVTRPVFQIPLATFTNPNGLQSLSGNVWIATDFSGNPTLRQPGDAGAGQRGLDGFLHTRIGLFGQALVQQQLRLRRLLARQLLHRLQTLLRLVAAQQAGSLAAFQQGPNLRVLLRRQRFFDRLGQRGVVRLGAGVEARGELAVAADDELAEVPRDGAGQRRAFARERGKERVLLHALSRFDRDAGANDDVCVDLNDEVTESTPLLAVLARDAALDVLVFKGPKSDSFTLLPKIYRGEHVPNDHVEELRAKDSITGA